MFQYLIFIMFFFRHNFTIWFGCQHLKKKTLNFVL